MTAWDGRALEWHSRGQRFDPAYLHQTRKALKTLRFQGFSFLRAPQSKRHFSAAPKPAIPPCNTRLGKKSFFLTCFCKILTWFVDAIQPLASAPKQAVPPKIQWIRTMPPLPSSTRSIRSAANSCCWLVDMSFLSAILFSLSLVHCSFRPQQKNEIGTPFWESLSHFSSRPFCNSSISVYTKAVDWPEKSSSSSYR